MNMNRIHPYTVLAPSWCIVTVQKSCFEPQYYHINPTYNVIFSLVFQNDPLLEIFKNDFCTVIPYISQM